MTPGQSSPVIHVLAAAVIGPDGRVLIAQRPVGRHLAGGWEFPGGKLEPHEDRRAGLARELSEEIGIEIGTPRPLLRVRHHYPDRDVMLDVWVVRRYRGDPTGLDGQALRWCTREELAEARAIAGGSTDRGRVAFTGAVDERIDAVPPRGRLGVLRGNRERSESR